MNTWSGIFALTKGESLTNSSYAEASKKSISINLEPDLFGYIGWVPRFLELFSLCRYCRRHKDNIQVPCIAYLGSADELVSMRSKKYLEGNPNVTLKIMDGVGHMFYPPEYMEQMCEDLRILLKQIEA